MIVLKLINLVTGGAGFLGSNLIYKLLSYGEKVICLDNFETGQKNNIIKLLNQENFQLINHDVSVPIIIEVDRIWHLACPASPIHYQSNPIKTMETNFMGTFNMLNLAKKNDADFLLASTSEVYGNPEVHPQDELYKGSVNTTGRRSCYIEGKRIAETLSTEFKRMYGTKIRIARIFNTYGPNMSVNDGRVVSNFIIQALKGNPLTVYGDGTQTRSFCYVDDLVRGLMNLMDSDFHNPINLGYPKEYSINQLAELIIQNIDLNLKIILQPLPPDDPKKRKPKIDLALRELNWKPEVNLKDGLLLTINYFQSILN